MKRSNVAPLTGLALVVVAGFSYILFGVMGWRIGPQRFPVTVVLSRAGGIYPEGDVTYRGVAVGQVTAVKVGTDHVDVTLGINPGTRISAHSTASVRELTGVGEQYLDLVPAGSGGPWLHSGSVISEARTAVPTSINGLLIDFGRLLTSINTRDIETLNEGLSTGLGGIGPELRVLVAESSNLVSALRASEPATAELQVGGRSVLTTALATSADFAKFSSALASATAQLKVSNPDLEALLRNGAAFETQFRSLLTNDSSSIEALISHSSTVLTTAAARNPAIRALFQALPVFAGDLAAVSKNGQIRSELTYNDANTVCPYISGAETPSPTERTGAPDLSLQCLLSAPDLLQRGAPRLPATGSG